MRSNITNVRFLVTNVAKTAPLYQYDYGQILNIEGLSLPSTFEVHFSNDGGATTTTAVGSENQVTIPDTYLTSGNDIIGYIYLHTGAEDGETVYVIKIPVKKRQRPSDTPPTPVQQSAIDTAIAALNAEVEAVEKFTGFVVERVSQPYTSYSDAIAAYNSGKRLVCHVTISGKAMWLSDYYVNTTFGNEGIYFCVPMADGPTHYYVVSSDEFTDGTQLIADWSEDLSASNDQPVQGKTIYAAIQNIGFAVDENGVLSFETLEGNT